MLFEWHLKVVKSTNPFTFSSYSLAYTTMISFFPLHFHKFLEENLSKSPSFSQLLPVIISSWYHTLPSIPIMQDVKWKSPWYIKPLTLRTTVSPSRSDFKVLLILIFLESISKTSTFGEDLKLMGCIIAEKHQGHFSCVSCLKDLSQWLADFHVFSFSYCTKSNLPSMDEFITETEASKHFWYRNGFCQLRQRFIAGMKMSMLFQVWKANLTSSAKF